jgi:hypothetical protein
MSLDTAKTGRQPTERITVPQSEAAASASGRPEFFRLPKSGGDPFFGIGRSFYYKGEALGYWRLIRIRDRGKARGVTLVPYAEVLSFLRKQTEEA